MKTDFEIRNEGFKLLFQYMDSVDAERFLALVNRDRFDYTKWREGLFENMSLTEIIEQGKNYSQSIQKKSEA